MTSSLDAQFSTNRVVSFHILTLFCCCLATNLQGARTEKHMVVVDTDAGPDDAMGILMLLSNVSSVEVVAITCVTGNTGAHNVSKNVLKTLDTVEKLNIPVYVGSTNGMVYSSESSMYFGSDGFGDFVYPNPPSEAILKSEHAAIALANIVKNNPGEITILSIGPLTNVALAMHLNPHLLNELKQLIILGGSYKGAGNVKPGVEFNVFTDPEAASYVFSHAPPSIISLLPIEVIQNIPFSMTWRRNVLGSLGSKQMNLLNKAEAVALNNQKEWFCYDPTAAAVLLNPNIIEKSMTAHVFIETVGVWSRGAMFHSPNSSGSVRIVTDINLASLKTLLIKNLA